MRHRTCHPPTRPRRAPTPRRDRGTLHPRRRGHKTVKKLLIELLRISSADAGARVAAAKDLGTWHTLTGQDLPVTLPDTAAAQRDGEIGADHARTIRNVIRKIPDAVPAQERDWPKPPWPASPPPPPPKTSTASGTGSWPTSTPTAPCPTSATANRRRGITLGRQDTAAMSPLSGHLSPTARAMVDAVLAKYARPGMNNPADPESPTGPGDGT